jgi:hypothetical protein
MRRGCTSNNDTKASRLSFDDFLQARAYSATIVLPIGLHEHVTAAEAGNAEAIALVQGIARWLRAVESAALRCLACDRTFHHSDQIGSFAVVAPFADPAKMIVGGFCGDCAARHQDLLAIVLQRAREIWDGGVHPIDGGHA